MLYRGVGPVSDLRWRASVCKPTRKQMQNRQRSPVPMTADWKCWWSTQAVEETGRPLHMHLYSETKRVNKRNAAKNDVSVVVSLVWQIFAKSSRVSRADELV